MADILVPALGESVTEATVARWTKKAGDAVKKDELLVELETDKVNLEVVAPSDGVLSEVAAAEGATVGPGQVLGRVGNGASQGAPVAGETGVTQGTPTRFEADASPSYGGTTNPPTAVAPDGEGQPEMGAPQPGSAAAPPPNDALQAGDREGIAVVVPSLGESVTEGSVARWSKKVGDAVKKDELLVEIETDKVAVELAAPQDGVLSEIVAQEGATVHPGEVVARVSGGAGASVQPAQAKPAQAPTPAPQPAQAAPAAAEPAKPLSPSVQRVVAENRLDPAAIQGTGKDGRITKGDALAALSQPQSPAAPPPQARPAAPAQQPPREAGPREERVRMTRLRQTIARRLKEAQNTAAMLTTFNEVDMSGVMNLRNQYKDAFEKRHGVKLGFMSFFVKAAVAALKEIPAVNAEIDGTDIVYKQFYNIGVAVGTEKGLVVPVLNDADQLGFADIEKTIGDLGKQARDGTLSLDQLQGGTFTISNGGVYGSLMSTPILNAPQSGILGMHKIQERPVVIGGKIEIRPMMYLALSYDHRIVDGKEAVTFLVRIKEHVEDPERLLLEV